MPNRSLVEELSRVDGKAEIIHGQIVHLPMAGCWPGIACGEILYSLHGYAKVTKYGCSFGSRAGFLVDLPHRKSFCPDTGYYIRPTCGNGILRGCACLRGGKSVMRKIMAPLLNARWPAKRADYFAAGTLVVWDVDLLSDAVVRIFRDGDPDHPAIIYRRGQTAEAEPAVPAWTMLVDDLFDT